MEHFFSLFVSLIKLPFLAIIKIFITFLNLFPLPVYEIHGRRGTSNSNRPDMREFHTKIRGQRKAHLGSCLVAWTRGVIFKAHINSDGATCWGIYTEDYQDIQSKWVW